jgi:hypothetical protein
MRMRAIVLVRNYCISLLRNIPKFVSRIVQKIETGMEKPTSFAVLDYAFWDTKKHKSFKRPKLVQ